MSKQFNRIGATTNGYRGKRAILEQRVIEGFKEADFTDSVLQLNHESAQTQHLTTANAAEGDFIVLPNAQTLWNNWKVTIINDSAVSIPVYYFTEDYTDLNLFKEITAGNMATIILLDNTTEDGTWTTLRTLDTITADTVEKYTTNVYETTEISWYQLKEQNSTEVELCSILHGTPLKSIYIKPTETFTGMSSLTLSVGTDEDHERFFKQTSITGAISNTYFSKDIIEEILSTSEEVVVKAFFNGTGVENLTAGKIGITIERVKLIDPTVLKNPNINTQIPVGVIMNYVFNDLPSGYFRLDGGIYPNANQTIPTFVNKLITANAQLISEKLIVGSDEWDRIYNANGSCGKFCWRGANLQFPAINCFIKGLTDLTQLSKFESDTMRPITGTLRTGGKTFMAYPSATGALNIDETYWEGWTSTSGHGESEVRQFSINSARLGAAYNGTETQPKHIKYPYIISVYNKIQATSEFNIQDLLDSTIYKANVDLDNISDAGKNVIKNNVSITPVLDWPARIDVSGRGFTAPTDGFVMIGMQDHDSNYYVRIFNPQGTQIMNLNGGYNNDAGSFFSTILNKDYRVDIHSDDLDYCAMVFVPFKTRG